MHWQQYHIFWERHVLLQITPDQAYANYQESPILQEVTLFIPRWSWTWNDKRDLSQLPFADIDDTEYIIHYSKLKNFMNLESIDQTKESNIIGMAQANLQGAQINFGPYLSYNRQVQPPLQQHRL